MSLASSESLAKESLARMALIARRKITSARGYLELARGRELMGLDCSSMKNAAKRELRRFSDNDAFVDQTFRNMWDKINFRDSEGVVEIFEEIARVIITAAMEDTEKKGISQSLR